MVKFKGKNVQSLGDGVYASYTNGDIWLETSNGITVTNAICIEPEVYINLVKYITGLALTSGELT